MFKGILWMMTATILIGIGFTARDFCDEKSTSFAPVQMAMADMRDNDAAFDDMVNHVVNQTGIKMKNSLPSVKIKGVK